MCVLGWLWVLLRPLWMMSGRAGGRAGGARGATPCVGRGLGGGLLPGGLPYWRPGGWVFPPPPACGGKPEACMQWLASLRVCHRELVT